MPISNEGSSTFRLAAGDVLYALTDRIAHTMFFVMPVVDHRIEREIAQLVNHDGLILRPYTEAYTKLRSHTHTHTRTQGNLMTTSFSDDNRDIEDDQAWRNDSVRLNQ